MKNKKLSIILIIILVIVGGIGTYLILNKVPEKEQTETKKTDALKFKEEYESLNGVKREKDGKIIRSITIPEKNPFIYTTAEELVEKIKSEKSFVVYFGFTDCPWCRSVLPTLIKCAQDNSIDKILYVDVKEIRDTLTLNEKGKPETTKKGTDAYYELIDLFSNVLSDYNLYDKNNKPVKTEEKRIFAPNIVVVKNGKAISLTEGISDKQKDGYDELTDEIIKDMYNMLDKVLKDFEDDVCTSQGC